MRLYGPDQEALQAPSGSNIEFMLGVPNEDLQGISITYPRVIFWYIAVSNEISPVNSSSQYANYILSAIQNIYNAIAPTGLEITHLLPSIPSSFRDDVSSYIDPTVSFLTQNGDPLLVNVYPYFSYKDNTGSMDLSYALFTSSSVAVQDPYSNLGYQNLFDAIVDAVYSALDKVGGSNVGIVVSKSGWSTAGGTKTTVENAMIYNNNLIQHVKNGTPKKSGSLETYVFAMFDENEKSSDVEMH
ncbi:hypothetical protein NE237_005093 [Protea cynaroides]|uniref:Beta-1,3-glucanase n=1 Tax=Protea cynaroides TaxID=273540 RepID=A0A9Q0KKP5_9MAGN|nr:hypothetical protein NE237_005093 [Protea cynaroides]